MFKVGDRVKARYPQPHKNIFTGIVWTVSSINGEWMSFTENGFAHHVGNFDKVDEMTIEINPKAKPKKADTKPQANVFYVRRVGTVTEKVVHKTFEDARNEANRLAELTPNHEFQVLAVAYTVKKVPVYTTEAQEYHV